MNRDDQLDLFAAVPEYTPTPAARLAAPTAEPDASIDRAQKAAGEAWNILADAAIRFVAEENEFFTTDLIWERISEPLNSPRALGARMRAAKKAGLIEATDRYVPSTSEDCHYRPIRVWRSLVYRRPKPR